MLCVAAEDSMEVVPVKGLGCGTGLTAGCVAGSTALLPGAASSSVTLAFNKASSVYLAEYLSTVQLPHLPHMFGLS